MPFCIACRRSVRDTFGFLSSRVVPILVIAALLSPTVFIVFSGTAEASGIRPRKAVTAPQSAPPELFVIGAKPSNPILAILAVEAFGSIKTSVLAMFANTNAEARTSVRANRTTPDSALANARASTNETTAVSPPQPASIVDFDFDNDGKADIGRWKPGTSEFEIDPSGGGGNLVYDIGSPTSKFVPGDFNGDGSVDAVVFDSGTWVYKTSPTATAVNISLGQSGDTPVPADFDGDGTTDAAVFRSSNGTWYVKQSSTGNTVSVAFGTSGDVPVTGDFDGDGVADLAVFRPSSGYWHVQSSTSGYSTFPWGLSSDVPAPADFDGDGKTDPAVYRGGSGTWYALKSGTGYATHETRVWGSYGDQPVPGDYDGDSKADFAVWRPTTGVWYIARSSGGYDYHTLGVAGDRAVPSAFIKQIGGEVAPYELAKARLSPKNATGGTDLYSQNFSWGTSLVGLPGRAGLNAGFGMSYNSLVWTKEGSNVHFDTNYDNISPGFRFGFPTIEAPYYIEGGGEGSSYFVYIMVSPSGARTEFRQIAASGTFETADSSYLQLTTNSAPDPNTPVENITLTVRGTDGTQMSYVWLAGAFRCTRILDRNGNYITIDHSEYGQLTKVTDTLGREINVNYSEDLYPISITQTWKDSNGSGSNTTHTWATFGYANATLNPTWHSSITSTGPPAGTILKVLEKVTYPDLSSTKFYYNDYGQVSKIENIAADSPSHVLNHVRTNLESPGSNLTDVPRLGETRTFVENFNSGNETVVTNTLTTGHQVTDITGATVTASLIQVAMQNHPNGSITNTYVGQSGWMEGLPILVNDYAEGDYYTPKRSSWTGWTQDDVGSADTSVRNPRVTETKIGDGVNLKRSTIDYLLYPSTTVSKFGLVSAVNVYDTNQSTVLKRAETDYNLTAAYLDRRIIGVPSETRVFGVPTSVGSLELVSKMTYGFDEGDFTQEPNQIISPIRHDTAKYGSSFIVGRGNLTSTTRHDVTGQTAAVTSRVVYDIAGSPVAQFDPLNRRVAIDYSDAFNDGQNRNGFAYPTKVYDPAGNYSEVKYRHDIGANVRAQSPAPAGNTQGKITEREYDSIGRLLKDKIVNLGGAYTRYEYPTNGIHSKVFSTIIDTNANGADTADEVLSESWSDGAGRTRMTRTPHTFDANGNTLTWAGTLTEYDALGRVKRSSVPTEVDSDFAPTDDDATRGFLWTHQKYDWMNRATRKINTDGIDSPTLNDSDVLISYTGCGCAGGLVVTIEGELVPRDDQPTVNARRVQKVYADIFGRSWKTVQMKWDGTTPYTTTEQAFNGRDQVLTTKQIDNTSTANPQTSQVSTMTYDGHGRLKTRHYPIEDAATSTTWIYNSDDSIQQIIDPRGAITNFAYNDSRGLLTNISYSVPSGSTIPVTPSASFGHDNLGNRISMIDGSGTTAYSYNELSQLTSETKTFSGLTGNFTLGYAYHIGGGLKSITDPFQSTVDYVHDKAGRLTSVDGTPFGNNISGNYADQIKYRAFGSIKQMNYKTDDNAQVSMQYDNRLRVNNYQVASSVVAGGFVQKADYEYFADSSPKAVDNVINAAFDRTFKYDFAGRLTHNQFGMGTRPDGQQFRTYSQTIQYDAFSNMTSRQTGIWSGGQGFTATYVNGRRQAAGSETLTFDALGNMVEITYGSSSRVVFERNKFDAAGRMAEFSKRQKHGGGQTTFHDITAITTQTYDGDGERVKKHKRVESTQAPAPPGVPQPVVWVEAEYYVRSSVTGKMITELDATGGKLTTKIYLGSALLAEQKIYPPHPQNPGWSQVIWQHGDPVTGSTQQTVMSGEFSMFAHGRYELEPLGGIVPGHDPFYEEEINPPEYEWGGDIHNPEWGCTLPDIGVPAPCSVAAAYMNHLERLQYTQDRINNNRSRLGKHTRPMRPPMPIVLPDIIPGFIRADNRRDDEFYRVPGVRVARTEFIDDIPINVWAVDNSTAAQTQTTYTNKSKAIRKAIEDADTILRGDSDCAKFFGKYALKALAALDKKLERGTVDGPSNVRTGIRMETKKVYSDTMGDAKIVGNTTVQEKAYRVFEIATVNSYGPFFNMLSPASIGGYNPNSQQSRVLQILHELAHMIYKPDGKGGYEPLIPNDGDIGGGDSVANTNKILNDAKCKAEIDKLGKKKK